MKNMSNSVSKSKGNGPANHDGGSGSFESSGFSDCPGEQMARASYTHAKQNGFSPDDALADWFQAAADLRGLRGSGQ